jgi:hypothetical protein
VGDSERARTEVPREQTPQMPARHAEAGGQAFHVAIVAHSGRQRRHGRYPASLAAAAVGKKVTFSLFGVFAGHIGRQ